MSQQATYSEELHEVKDQMPIGLRQASKEHPKIGFPCHGVLVLWTQIVSWGEPLHESVLPIFMKVS
jgi:hypothetical protein